MTETLGVFLASPRGEVRVGALHRSKDGVVRFIQDRDYVEMGHLRPVLTSSIRYMADEERTVRELTEGQFVSPARHVHPWFSNLLPEGVLREMVSAGLPRGGASDFDMLRALGNDLPGAVLVRPEDGVPPAEMQGPAEMLHRTVDFSISGVQFKTSMTRRNGRLDFPAAGETGDTIVKFPSSRPGLPEVEYSCMRMVGAVGIRVPRFDLVPMSSVNGMSEEVMGLGESVLALDRFDRGADGTRVHVEDFCQVMGVMPDRKYLAASEEAVFQVATRMGAGGISFQEIVRRSVANILIGNGDAHLKNHAIMYPDGVNGQLSPAYDVVSTFLYEGDDSLALKFQKTSNSRIVNVARYVRSAELCGFTQAFVKKEVMETAVRASDLWPGMVKDLPLPEGMGERLIARAQSLALARDFDLDFRVGIVVKTKVAVQMARC